MSVDPLIEVQSMRNDDIHKFSLTWQGIVLTMQQKRMHS